MEETGVEILTNLAEIKFDVPVKEVLKMPGAGSGRKYYRLIPATDGQVRSCIGVIGENVRDCRAFVNLACGFYNNNICVPAVYSMSEDKLHYIQEDLGDISLFDIIKEECGNISHELQDIIKVCIENLADMQCLDSSIWEDCVEYQKWGERQVMWDLNYFKYEYLRPSGVDFDEELLENDFERFTSDICDLGKYTDGFMFRDFQSRNIMIKDRKPYFIDFQGGRRGPGIYDAISFLWQARAGFSDEFRRKMLKFYFDCRANLDGYRIDDDKIHKMTDMFAVFRTLQVLGAYGLRGLVERKSHFLESIPGALDNLNELVGMGVIEDYPELERVCKRICIDPRFKKEAEDGLKIEIFSFSYKKGYPADYSGNGGGFMFDCRGMHNPGRYPEYKKLTGRDLPVIKFLEEKGEVQNFITSVVDIVSPSIETYLRRGFTNLQIGFGCTGGQHRSVYCAEHVAQLLRIKYPSANIKVIHREHP